MLLDVQQNPINLVESEMKVYGRSLGISEEIRVEGRRIAKKEWS